jgi:hypothetical protein
MVREVCNCGIFSRLEILPVQTGFLETTQSDVRELFGLFAESEEKQITGDMTSRDEFQLRIGNSVLR